MLLSRVPLAACGLVPPPRTELPGPQVLWPVLVEALVVPDFAYALDDLCVRGGPGALATVQAKTWFCGP